MKIAAWNLLNGFSDPARIDEIAEGIISVNADFWVFPEGYNIHLGEPDLPSVLDSYRHWFVDYSESDHEAERAAIYHVAHGFVVLSRLEMDVIALEIEDHRSQVLAIDHETGLTIAGIHWDDRSNSRRIAQMQPFFECNHPDVIIGDNNIIDGDGIVPRILGFRIVGAVAECIPRRFKRQRSILRRSHDMRNPGANQIIKSANYIDAAPGGKPTCKLQIESSRAVVRIDKLHYDPSRVSVKNFSVHELPGSDHFPISADVSPIS